MFKRATRIQGYQPKVAGTNPPPPRVEDLECAAIVLKSGDLSRMRNPEDRRDIGKFLSPKGTDSRHRITLRRKSCGTVIAEVESTNSLYTEWVVACTLGNPIGPAVVLEDYNGLLYPVGRLEELFCSVEYL